MQLVEIADRDAWAAALAGAGRFALQQSFAYGAAMTTLNNAVERLACIEDGETTALCQVCTRRLPGRLAEIHVGLRGPVWLTADNDRRQRAAYALRRRYRWRERRFLIVQPEDGDAIALRRAGARQVVTGSATAWLDLGKSEADLRRGLDGKWRNALVKAEKSSLRVETSHGGRLLEALIQADEAQQRARGFFGPPGIFTRALTATMRRQDILVLSALDKTRYLAGMLFLRHGACATYSIGWSSDEGRQRAAHNLLLWRGIRALKQAGAQWLDLGGVNTEDGAGIARFKLGTGATPEILAGSFL